MLATEWGVGQVVLSMFWFTLFFIWIWLLIGVFADIFRSDDLGGWAKALWTFVIILTPYLGVFVYLIARGHKMHEHAVDRAKANDDAMRSYVQSVAGSDSSVAGELEKLAGLRDQGVISPEEFETGKAKVLAH